MSNDRGLIAAFFDLGDVIMQESTEIKDRDQATIHVQLVPGIDRVLRDLHARGVKLALVADTHRRNPRNVLGRYNLYDLFDAMAISQDLGVEKPDPRMFRHALDRLGIQPADYGRVVMVGNRLDRDIAGANRVGLKTIWFHWNERYRTTPENEMERPTFTVETAQQLEKVLSVLIADERR